MKLVGFDEKLDRRAETSVKMTVSRIPYKFPVFPVLKVRLLAYFAGKEAINVSMGVFTAQWKLKMNLENGSYCPAAPTSCFAIHSPDSFLISTVQ